MATSETFEVPSLVQLGMQAPAVADDADDDSVIEGYSAADLRTRLSRISIRFTGRRKMAVFAPLILAVFFWYSVPAFAAGLGDYGPTPSPITVGPANGPGTSTTGATQGQPPAAVVAAPAHTGAATPLTGANDGGFLRYILVGLCLVLSGLALITAPRRNPHAVFAGLTT